uniref:DH domain-containing protein n=1 Tax=Xiphophorus couchianus TaxID=32473 RepID=A0A3B5KQ82_9TELE
VGCKPYPDDDGGGNEGQHENGVHVVKDSDRQQRLRLCVLNEILNTERDYVRTLLFLQSVSLTFTPPRSLSVACDVTDRVSAACLHIFISLYLHVQPLRKRHKSLIFL